MAQTYPTSFQGALGLPPANAYGANQPLFNTERPLSPGSPRNRNAFTRTKITIDNEDEGLLSLRRSSLWLYVLLAVIVIGILWLIIYNAPKPNAYDAAVKPSWAPTSQVLYVDWIIALILLGIAGSRGNIGALLTDGAQIARNSIAIAFALEVILVIIWAVLFFTSKNFTWALIVGILAFVVGIWLLFQLWNADRAASYLLILYLLWVLYIVAVNWQIRNQNPAPA